MNQWNQLKDVFGAAGGENEIPECAADNICIAWPSILKCIANEYPDFGNKSVLDFGCGGGLFCNKLSSIGFQVTGYDESDELIKKAALNTCTDIIVTDSKSVMSTNGKYEIITSIMVLQFIEDINSAIDSILSVLKPDGLIVFAVFNPKFVEDNLNGDVFTGFKNVQSGYMELQKGLKIPVFNRDDAEYRRMFGDRGLEEVYLDCPVFTKEFLREHEMPFVTKHSEYQIQGFRRKS